MKLTIDVAPPYPVVVDTGLLEGIGTHITETTLALVSDTNVAPHYAQRVKGRLETHGKRVTLITVPAGEQSKSLETLGGLLRDFAQTGLNRASAVVALGGGVVSDLAGFAAACYMRGVSLYGLPTSLLAMVDASVGGKTGLNLPEGKNLVGAFWQPKAVLADVGCLNTLPMGEFKGGAVELYKHGLLADPRLLEDATRDGFRPDGDPAVLSDIIARAIAVKAEVVAADERETGRRAHLNLGHTLGHALEAHTRHTLSHGEAVGWGLLFAAHLAAQRGWADETARVLAFLRWLAPRPLPDVSFNTLAPYIARDKKHLDTTRWVLLERLTQPRIVTDVSQEALETAWAYLQGVTL